MGRSALARRSAATFPHRWRLPPACVFHPRCPRFQEGHCDVEMPLLAPTEGPTHAVACHYPLESWPLTEEELRTPGAAGVSS